MSPTVFRWEGYRFYFFSREEERRHVHVYCADGEAKFWLEPEVALTESYGLNTRQLTEIQKRIQERRNDIITAWNERFRS
jgi:hypothetical protein